MALASNEIKTWIDSFEYDPDIKMDVQRKYLAHYVNIGTDESPVWEVLGYKVAEASIQFNWEDDSVTDILGITYNTIKKSDPKLSLEGYIVNTQSKFLKQLTNMAIRNAYDEFSSFEILTVYFWLIQSQGISKLYLAKREKNCTIRPESLGGDGYVAISPEITLSNNATFGTVNSGIGTNVTFSQVENYTSVNVEEGSQTGETKLTATYYGNNPSSSAIQFYYKKDADIVPAKDATISISVGEYTGFGEGVNTATVSGVTNDENIVVVAGMEDTNNNIKVVNGLVVKAKPNA